MDFPNLTVLIYDSGLFMSWAEVLSKDYGRTLLYIPYKSQFVTSNQMRIGYGIPNVEHISPLGETRGRDFWDVVADEQIDLFIFPDIGDSDIQKELKRQGKRVWGSGNGDDLELYRPEAKRTFEKLGLPQPKWETCVGTDKLRKVLDKAKAPRWIKVSGHRGDVESFQYNPKFPEDTEQDLRRLEDKLGGLMTLMEFTVEDEIKPACEIGYDGPSIDGEFPPECIVGIEAKDAAYIGVVSDYNGLPEQLLRVNEALSPLLRNYEYRNFISTEVRVPDDLEPYLVDMTTRFPSPPSEGYQSLVKNWGEIFWYGSEGILVPWKFRHKYLAMAIMKSEDACHSAVAVRFPKELSEYYRLKNFCVIDDVHWVLPQTVAMQEIGSVIATSDDPLEAISLCHERCQLTNQKCRIELSKAVQSFQEGIDSGVKFSNLQLPTVEEIATAIK